MLTRITGDAPNDMDRGLEFSIQLSASCLVREQQVGDLLLTVSGQM